MPAQKERPLLSGLSCLIVLASFAIPLAIVKPAFLGAVLDRQADVHQAPPWFWAVTFTFYFVNYFVIYFFNSALVYCALAHFRGEDVSAEVRSYINRLSDFLFVASRYVNEKGAGDVLGVPGANR